MENWDENDFQGRRKSQVEYSYKVIYYCVILTIFILFIYGILYLCNLI